jgi:hypothetical protein
MRAAVRTLAVVLLLVIVLVPTGDHSPLDPDEPIAADGSFTAGNARTIFGVNPLLDAFTEPERPDPDDPKEFKARFDFERDWTERSRDVLAGLLGRIDWSLCDPARRKPLIDAIRKYYGARTVQKANFSRRGPRAAAFIEGVWSTPTDQRIDQFAKQLVTSGFLQMREVPKPDYPEFAKVTHNATAIGKTCPPPNAGRL